MFPVLDEEFTFPKVCGFSYWEGSTAETCTPKGMVGTWLTIPLDLSHDNTRRGPMAELQPIGIEQFSQWPALLFADDAVPDLS